MLIWKNHLDKVKLDSKSFFIHNIMVHLIDFMELIKGQQHVLIMFFFAFLFPNIESTIIRGIFLLKQCFYTT